jgi:hypothetical protein
MHESMTKRPTQLSFQDFPPRKRPIPRPFSFPWGDGQILEEAAVRGKHHEPCIQLLEFTDGFELVRFCSYTLDGRFERNSWIAGSENLKELSFALQKTPRLRQILSELIL